MGSGASYIRAAYAPITSPMPSSGSTANRVTVTSVVTRSGTRAAPGPVGKGRCEWRVCEKCGHALLVEVGMWLDRGGGSAC